ncbi:MAG: zinc ribbon domain-containing protein [Pseudomonadota bacterium]
MIDERSKRVYAYGCRAPMAGSEAFEAQLRLAHNYYNRLIEIERTRREKYHELCGRYQEVVEVDAALTAVNAALDMIYGVIAASKMKGRSRKAVDPQNTVEAKRLQQQRRFLYDRRKKAESAAKKNHPELMLELEQMQLQTRMFVKSARGEYSAKGLYWGTYLIIEQAYELAKKSHGPPHFRRWDGTGQIAVQIQHGKPVEEIIGGADGRLQIDAIDSAAWSGSRGERRRATRTMVRIRAHSDDKKDPVWVELPVVLHRPMPAGGRIWWARLCRKRVAGTFEYELQITVDIPIPSVEVDPRTAVGVDLGWRRRDDGIRVLTWQWQDGRRGELRCDTMTEATMAHAQSLQSIRGKNLDAMRAGMVEWMRGHPLPEWMTESTDTFGLWRSPGRFAALAIRWRNLRFDGDAEGFDLLEAWRKQDRHLWEWQSHEVQKAILRRREQYRVWARGIVRQSSLIAIEDFDLRQMARQTPPEEPGKYDDLARAQRIVTAPSTARQALEQAAASAGVPVIKVPCPGTTYICRECGCACEWDQAREIRHTCEGCGREWDQDENAATNILRAGQGYVASGKLLADQIAKKNKALRGGRFQRRAAAKVEVVIARKALDTSSEIG